MPLTLVTLSKNSVEFRSKLSIMPQKDRFWPKILRRPDYGRGGRGGGRGGVGMDSSSPPTILCSGLLFILCLRVSSMRMRNCWSWGLSSLRVRPRRIDESIRPLMEIFSMLSRFDRSITLQGGRGGGRGGREGEGERGRRKGGRGWFKLASYSSHCTKLLPHIHFLNGQLHRLKCLPAKSL